MYFSAMYTLISQGVHPLWGVKHIRDGEKAIFESISLARWRWYCGIFRVSTWSYKFI